MVIWGDFVEYRFFAFHALMSDHISFIFPVIYVCRPHLSMTFGRPISGVCIIHVFGTETVWAVVPCGSFRMDGNSLMAVSTFEILIIHHKSHILYSGFIIKMVGEFPEEFYEFLFIERMFLHEGFQRFAGIVESDIVISFPNHDIEEGSFLIPGEYSFAIGKGILFHDAIQEKIDISDDPIFPDPVGKGFLSVFLMVYELVSGSEFPEDEYLIEKKEREFLGKFPKENIRFLGEIHERMCLNDRCGLFFPEEESEHRLAGFKEANLLSSLVDIGRILAEYLPYFIRFRYEMDRLYLIFLLFHDQMTIPEKVGEETMHLHVYLHDFPHIHDLEVFLKDQRTIDDDELVPNDDDQSVVIPDDSEYELDEAIIHQKENDREEYVAHDIGSILAEILFVDQKRSEKHSCYDDQEEEFRYEIQEIDKVSRDDRIIFFRKDIHMKGL